MKKILSFFKGVGGKVSLALACMATSAIALAEGEQTSGVTSTLVTPYITDGKTQILAVLTAGAVIVGAFFVWGLVKKALKSSK